MKRFISALIVGLALLAFVPAAQAYVNVTGYNYDRPTGDFTITVKASEPWVVWFTTDFRTWERISPVMGAGRKVFVDEGVGLTHPWGFYSVVPKGKHPNNGRHFGWSQPNNPHSVD
jgi:hypothetical protein